MEIINEIVKAVGAADIGTGVTAAGLGSIKKDSFVGMLYEDIAQPSVQKLGLALSNISEILVIPTLYIKHGSDLIKANLANRVDSYKEKLDQIPPEKLIAVNPQIGIPIFERLSYITNDEVAELYLNLLAKGSSSDTVNEAHPAFIQVLERLSADEAKLLKYLKEQHYIPFVTLRIELHNATENAHSDTLKYSTMLQFEDIRYPDYTSFYISNLIGSGILEVSDEYITNEPLYDTIIDRYKIHEIIGQISNVGTGIIVRGTIEVTAFGEAFLKACIV